MKIKNYKTKNTVTFELKNINSEKAFVKFDFDNWQEHEMNKSKKEFKFKTDFPKSVDEVEFIYRYIDEFGQDRYTLDPGTDKVESEFGYNSIVNLAEK